MDWTSIAQGYASMARLPTDSSFISFHSSVLCEVVYASESKPAVGNLPGAYRILERELHERRMTWTDDGADSDEAMAPLGCKNNIYHPRSR
nr:hypothetical protein CFP56_69485 [Quercus suber]